MWPRHSPFIKVGSEWYDGHQIHLKLDYPGRSIDMVGMHGFTIKLIIRELNSD